jgi:hypothetical protein
MDYPVRLPITAKSETNGAAVEIRSVGASEKTVNLLLNALSGNKQVQILLTVQPDSTGKMAIEADELQIVTSDLLIQTDNTILSTASAKIASQECNIVSMDSLNLVGNQSVSIGGNQGHIGFYNTIIGALSLMKQKAKNFIIEAVTYTIKASIIKLNSPKGQLGGGGLGVARLGDRIQGVTSDGKLVTGTIISSSQTWTCS